VAAALQQGAKNERSLVMVVNNTELLGTGVVLLLLVFAGIVVRLALHEWRHRKGRK
jgi:hypothetical protein